MKLKTFYRTLGKDKYFKIWHASAEHMLIYMESEGGCIVCNEKTYPIQKGVLCFVGAGKYHYTMPDEPQKYMRSKIFIPPQIFKRWLSALQDASAVSVFAENAFVYAEIEAEKRDAVREIFKQLAEEKCTEPELLSGVMKLLALCKADSREVSYAPAGFMDRAIEYINRNIHVPLDIDAICAAIHISKFYFCREFKKQTGLTVMNYILKTRIILSQSMLKDRDVSVSEVSEKCGFSSVSYFCRVFKNHLGISPLQYRNGKL